MSPEQFTALIVAVTGLIAAVGVVLAQVRQTHNLVNSRMTELLDATKLASQKTGELQGRDQERTRTLVDPPAAGRTAPPTR